MPEPALGEAHPRVSLVIFDKDGTLIDFDAMWSGWIEHLAGRIEAVSSRPFAQQFFAAVGYDPATGHALPNLPLAVGTMDQIRSLAAIALQTAGLAPEASEQIIAATWDIPDPVATAQPLADLTALFETLRHRDIRIAIATTDDRDPTQSTLDALGVAHYVDRIASGDDGLTIKPAPDAVLSICATLGIPPAETVVVGDSPMDMQMGRTAGAGLVIGVLSGVGSRDVLAPLADRVIPSIRELVGELEVGRR